MRFSRASYAETATAKTATRRAASETRRSRRSLIDAQRPQDGRPDRHQRLSLLRLVARALQLHAPRGEAHLDVRQAGLRQLFLRRLRLGLQAFQLEDHARLRRGPE